MGQQWSGTATTLPKLLYKRSVNETSIEIWTTTCIVTNFGKSKPSLSNCNVLINPGNPALSGVANFPYFPKGGPVPKEKPRIMLNDCQPYGYMSYLSGMEVGDGLLYPESVVDGIVHQLGGLKLRAECEWKRRRTLSDPCPIGTATSTSAGDKELQKHYDLIIHTTPPFFKQEDNPRLKLYECYMNSFNLSLLKSGESRIAVPLLGSGARGFSDDVAIEVAAAATIDWCSRPNQKLTLATKQMAGSREHDVVFGLLDEKVAEQLAESIDQFYATKYST